MSKPAPITARRRPGRSAFTLVEMLAVMGIIVISLVLLLPAMKGLTQSNGQKGAVDTLMGVLDRARMMAIADGQSTYVVFACPPALTPQSSGGHTRTDFWARAYAIYENHDNISFTPEQKTPWIQLPVGVSFKISETGPAGSQQFASVLNRLYDEPTNSDPAYPVQFPVTAAALPPGSTGPVQLQLPYWKFSGTGMVDEQTATYLRVFLFPGYVNASGTEVSTQNNGAAGGNVSAVELDEIDLDPATGRARYNVNTNNNATPTPAPTATP